MTAASAGRQLSTADERRETVVRKAVHAFARRGYYGTPTVDVAKEAGISQAYLYRLYHDKEELFQAVVEHAFTLIRNSLADGAAAAQGSDPASVLYAMGDAYARLISDEDLLMVLMHAQCAASEPAIRETVRRGYARLVEYARGASGADDGDLQTFFARGQLCQLLVTLDTLSLDTRWARTLDEGFRHYGPDHA